MPQISRNRLSYLRTLNARPLARLPCRGWFVQWAAFCARLSVERAKQLCCPLARLPCRGWLSFCLTFYARQELIFLSGIFCSPLHKLSASCPPWQWSTECMVINRPPQKLTAARPVRQRRYCRHRTLFQPPHATPLQVLRPHRHA